MYSVEIEFSVIIRFACSLHHPSAVRHQVRMGGGDRRAAPMGAPPHGLFLHEVVYPEALWETWEPPEEGDEGENVSE